MFTKLAMALSVIVPVYIISLLIIESGDKKVLKKDEVTYQDMLDSEYNECLQRGNRLCANTYLPKTSVDYDPSKVKTCERLALIKCVRIHK